MLTSRKLLIHQFTATATATATATTTILHPFNGLFSRTIWVSQYQKAKNSLDLNEARDDGVWGYYGIIWSLDHMQTVCTLQTDNHTNNHSIIQFLTGRMIF